MNIEVAIALYTKEELNWLKAGLPNLLNNSKNNINITLFLSHITDYVLEESHKLCDHFGINFEPRGDNSLIKYYDEVKHKAFDINNNDCAVVLQPDIIFTKKNVFDDVMDEASQYFDEKYQINVSTDSSIDTLPLGIQIFTKKMWSEVGCGDINYYPAPGSEYDEYRRCCIAWNVDFLNNIKEYNKYLDGRHTPPFNKRICTKNLIHVHKFRGNTEEEYPLDQRLFRKAADYSSHVVRDCLRFFDVHFLHYHFEKWGGTLGQEKFINPFNSEKNSVKINWDQMLDPYPDCKYVSLRGLVT